MSPLSPTHTRSIWVEDDGWSVGIFDQRRLPWETARLRLTTAAEAAEAIATMATRGAPLIGATAAYGLALALRADPSDANLAAAFASLAAARPTAVNLVWALARLRAVVAPLPPAHRAAAAYAEAAALCDEDVATNRAIGEAGLALLRDLARAKLARAKPTGAEPAGAPVNILTHCNPGGLATVALGTATAPIYLARETGLAVHVWVSETRPRNQGALTAFELADHGVPHQLIADNAAGLLMARGLVDVVLVGTDRVAANGDVCNKIGTYLKALAARAHHVPFYVALPMSSFDPATATGADIPIEERDPREVTHVDGRDADGMVRRVAISGAPGFNPAFDVTPAALVTGYITEHGVVGHPADLKALAGSTSPSSPHYTKAHG